MTYCRCTLVLVLGTFALGACTSSGGACGAGQSVEGFCAYSTSAIVIEGGFECPANLPMRFEFDRVVLCGPAGATPDDASSACVAGGFECSPPDIGPEPGPRDAGPADAGFGPCDAGPIGYCREHDPELGAGCCGGSVAPLCRIGGSGYACPEGSIESTECTTCL